MKYYIAAVLALLTVFYFGAPSSEYKCQIYGEVVGVETQYRLSTCFLKTSSGWAEWLISK